MPSFMKEMGFPDDEMYNIHENPIIPVI